MTQIALDIIKPPTSSLGERAAAQPDEGRFSETLANAANQADRVAKPCGKECATKKPQDDEATSTDAHLADEPDVQTKDQAPEETDEANHEGGESTVVAVDLQDVVAVSDKAAEASVEQVVTPRVEATDQGEGDDTPENPSAKPAPELQQQTTELANDEPASVDRLPSDELGASESQLNSPEEEPHPSAESASSESTDEQTTFVESDAREAASSEASQQSTAPDPTSNNDPTVPKQHATTPQAASVAEPVRVGHGQKGGKGEAKTESAPEVSRRDKEVDASILEPVPPTENALGANSEADDQPEAAPDDKPASGADAKSEHFRSARTFDRVAERITSARSTEPTGPSVEERVDAARFVGRVSRALETAQQRGETVRIRLSPPELGAMQIKLSVNAEGAMHASVETETSAARNVLLDNLPALRDRLAAMEVRVEKFDVNVGQQGSGSQDWNAGDSQDDRPQGDESPRGESRPTKQTTSVASPTNTKPTSEVGPDQINLVA